MKLLRPASLSFVLSTLLAGSAHGAPLSLESAPFNSQTKLVEFADFFNKNLAGKVFPSSNRDRPYQDKIIDYEYDISYYGMELDPAGGLSFKSTYNIKRLIYSVDQKGKKTGEPTIKQNTQTSQCSLHQMTKTTNELTGLCAKIADNNPGASILGIGRQLRILELSDKRLVWKDNTLGYVEGFLLDKKGYSPQFEIQTVSFELQGDDAKSLVMNKKVSTYNYDLSTEQVGSLLTETASTSTASPL